MVNERPASRPDQLAVVKDLDGTLAELRAARRLLEAMERERMELKAEVASLKARTGMVESGCG